MLKIRKITDRTSIGLNRRQRSYRYNLMGVAGFSHLCHKMNMTLHRSLFILINTLLLGLLCTRCFPRECEENANCIKTCDCLDTVTKNNTNCSMTFLCDAEERSCEASYDMECDELCATYAANDLCGARRCNFDSDCIRTATCEVTDSQGSAQQIACTQNFTCDDTVGTCESASILDDTNFCQLCLANATSQ